MQLNTLNTHRTLHRFTPISSRNTIHIAHKSILHHHNHLRILPRSQSNEDNSTPDNTNDPSQLPEQQQPSNTGSYAIPTTAIPPAGAIFILAGFLKILIVCFPFSTMAISMYLQGRADLGFWAALKMFPIAIGILALAKTIIDKQLYKKTWASRGIALFGIAALVLSRFLFARPRASPLDPMMESYKRQKIAAAIERERVARSVEEHERSIAEGSGGHRGMMTNDAARKYLEEKSKNTRFASEQKRKK